MAAVIVNRNLAAHRVLQPFQFRLIEYQIVAVGLRVVVRIVAQRITDQIEAIIGDQRSRGRTGAMLQVIRREHFCKIFRERFAAQNPFGIF